MFQISDHFRACASSTSSRLSHKILHWSQTSTCGSALLNQNCAVHLLKHSLPLFHETINWQLVIHPDEHKTWSLPTVYTDECCFKLVFILTRRHENESRVVWEVERLARRILDNVPFEESMAHYLEDIPAFGCTCPIHCTLLVLCDFLLPIYVQIT